MIGIKRLLIWLFLLGCITYAAYFVLLKNNNESPHLTSFIRQPGFNQKTVTEDSSGEKASGIPRSRPRAVTASNASEANSSINVYKYDSLLSGEILRLVQAGFGKKSLEDQFVAKYFTDICLLKISNEFGLGIQKPELLNAPQQRLFDRAHRELKSRCSELQHIPLNDLLAQRKLWQAELLKPQTLTSDYNLYVMGGGLNELSPEMAKRAREFILKSGAEALFWASGALAEIIRHQSEKGFFAADSPMAEPESILMAIELARCELGFDCGSQSLRNLMFCANAGLCMPTLKDAALQALRTDSLKAKAQEQAAIITAAFRDRDPTALGLPEIQVQRP